MNRVNIYRTAAKEQTAVSNLFIDEYMADANDAQLKIYLFLNGKGRASGFNVLGIQAAFGTGF